MEFSEQDLETIKKAEKAVRQTKYLQVVVMAMVLPIILLMAFDTFPHSDKSFFAMLFVLCATLFIRPVRAPSYAELVALLNKRKSEIDPMLGALAKEP